MSHNPLDPKRPFARPDWEAWQARQKAARQGDAALQAFDRDAEIRAYLEQGYTLTVLPPGPASGHVTLLLATLSHILPPPDLSMPIPTALQSFKGIPMGDGRYYYIRHDQKAIWIWRQI